MGCIPWDVMSRRNMLSRVCRANSQQEADFASLLATCFVLGTFLTFSSTLKMEAVCLEMSVIYRTTRCYIPVSNTLHSHNCEYLKSNILRVICEILFTCSRRGCVQNFEVIADKYEFIITDNVTVWVEEFQG
jgi:hypothetical protein